MPRWMRSFGRHQLLASDTLDNDDDDEERDPRAVMRGLIDEGARAADEAVEDRTSDVEGFRDEGNNRPVVQPSALLGTQQISGGEGWGDSGGK